MLYRDLTMLLWFVGTSVATVWIVFRDPTFRFRLVVVGALIPDVIDGLTGWRVAHSVVSVVVAMAVVMLATYDPVKRWLTQPYRNLCSARPEFKCDGSLFALGPLEGFTARLRVCAYGGLVLALPVVLWQIWRFIVPALNRREKRYAVPFIVSSVVLFAAG